MAKKVIVVNAELSKEYLYDQGRQCGLSEESADYFKYFNEVKIELTVESETGEVLKAEISK